MSWNCPCGTSNNDDRLSCRSCGYQLHHQEVIRQPPSPLPPDYGSPPPYPYPYPPPRYPPPPYHAPAPVIITQPPSFGTQFGAKTPTQAAGFTFGTAAGAAAGWTVGGIFGSFLGCMGLILLIAAIIWIGSLFSAKSAGGHQPSSAVAQASSFDRNYDVAFRRSCIATLETTDKGVGPAIIEQYCECALVTFRQTRSQDQTRQICTDKVRGAIQTGQLPIPPEGAPTISQFRPFTIQAGEKNAEAEPAASARLCLKTESQCFIFPDRDDGDQVRYVFGFNPKAEREGLPNGGSLILFSGTYSGSGSGTLSRLALLQYDAAGRITNLLPPVFLTEESDRRVLNYPAVSSLPVVETAAAKWSEGETHYERHAFLISAYLFDARQGKYTKRVEYETDQKYPSLDEVNAINVLGPEQRNILNRLQSLAGN